VLAVSQRLSALRAQLTKTLARSTDNTARRSPPSLATQGQEGGAPPLTVKVTDFGLSRDKSERADTQVSLSVGAAAWFCSCWHTHPQATPRSAGSHARPLCVSVGSSIAVCLVCLVFGLN
jgi:hypothetical protein